MTKDIIKIMNTYFKKMPSQKLKTYDTYLGEAMISVSENSVYFSSRIRDQFGFKTNDHFKFLYSDDKKTIGVKKMDQKKGISYKLNEKGYCKARIGTNMPSGRYAYSAFKSDGVVIFQMK